jgi:8-oxo-dGTP pyrophosphatase MutT (NUDIX family)
MKNEKACGAVIENEEEKILLIFQQNGFWGFPKGHVEEGETESETAVREVFEETGLWVELNEENRFEFSYDIKDLNIHKTVVLFTAKVVDDSRFKKQDEEIAEMDWFDKNDVEERLTFEDWKAVWRKIKKVI